MPSREFQRGYEAGVQAERERLVEALREQALCYPAGSAFAHVGDNYRSAAEFIEALGRIAPRKERQ